MEVKKRGPEGEEEALFFLILPNKNN